jgi:altronate dehydratase
MGARNVPLDSACRVVDNAESHCTSSAANHRLPGRGNLLVFLGAFSMATRVGVQVHPDDNVVTVVEGASAGDTIEFRTPDGPRRITAGDPIPQGHKLAIVDIAPGERVVKYRETIGTASLAIRAGQHVHAHNVRSAVQGGAR